MADNEVTKVGRAYRVCTDPNSNEFEKYSFWTEASDVELSDGQNLQTLVDKLNPDATGAVFNAQHATEALNAQFADVADETYIAAYAIDSEFIGDSIIDSIVEIQGNELVTISIRSPDEESEIDEIVEPYEVSRETVERVDEEIRIGDSFAAMVGKLKKKLADVSTIVGGMAGVSVTSGILYATTWNDGVYPLDNLFIPTNKRVITVPNADTLTAEQYAAWDAAEIMASATSNNLKVFGTVPTVDIPVIYYVIDPNAGGGGDTPTPTPVGTTDYNDLINKPTINGVTLRGDLYLSALMDESSAVSETDITIMVKEAFDD